MTPGVRARLGSALALGLAGCWLATGALAATGTSHATNWQTSSTQVICGIARIHGTAFDPGTRAQETGLWPGLQCSAPGIPRAPGSPGVGDPFVQLGQGRAGRAKVVDLSQDDLIYNRAPVTIPAGSTWKRDGITCTVHSNSISCHNTSGHGFKLSPGHLSTH